jgi:hypothetical protein
MKGVKFYLEYPSNADKRKATRTNLGNHEGNVIAILDNGIYISGGEPVGDGLGAVFYIPNSPVAGTGVSLAYLRERAKRISEKQAREIHPELFTRLDQD